VAMCAEPIRIETDRLVLQALTPADELSLAAVLSDQEAMIWYPRPYTAEEVRQWIERQIARYPEGSGLLAMVERQTGKVIGDCGAVWQEVDGVMELEIGYHVNRERWNHGFATEAARAVMDYAFRRLNVNHLISMIRPENTPSRRVAEKNGLTLNRMVFWRDYDHCVYQIARSAGR
jgi:[ribosomal protein S5]-alanine N-acetyltransferase